MFFLTLESGETQTYLAVFSIAQISNGCGSAFDFGALVIEPYFRIEICFFCDLFN